MLTLDTSPATVAKHLRYHDPKTSDAPREDGTMRPVTVYIATLKLDVQYVGEPKPTREEYAGTFLDEPNDKHPLEAKRSMLLRMTKLCLEQDIKPDEWLASQAEGETERRWRKAEWVKYAE